MQINEQTVKNIICANGSNPYADVTAYELGVGIPEVKYNGFFPRENEILAYAAPAQTFSDKEKVVGYTGKSAGVNIRVSKGTSVRTGGSGGNAIRQTVRDTNAGDLLITNKRVIFSGKADSFELPVTKISTVKPLDRTSLSIQSGNTSKNLLLDEYSVRYALGMINYVVSADRDGKNVYEALSKGNSSLTPEQKQLCDYARTECAKLNPSDVIPKNKNQKKVEKHIARNKRQWKAVKVLFIILAVVIVGSIILCSSLGKQSVDEPSSYATQESVSAEQLHNDKTINNVLNAYNAVAEYKVSSEDISAGSSNSNAKASINGVYILLYSSTGIAVDYQLEATDDSAIFPVFRDFCKAINPSLTDDELELAWNDMRLFEKPTSVSEIKAYNELEIGGIECTFNNPQDLTNGVKRFSLKTICSDY